MTERIILITDKKLEPDLKLEIIATLMEADEETDFHPVKESQITINKEVSEKRLP